MGKTVENSTTKNSKTVENSTTNSNAIKKQDSPETAYNKKALIKAMIANRGNVTNASKAAGLDRTTYYKYAKEDKAFKEACQDVVEINLDFVEDKLFQSIEKGDLSSIYFYLKCKGKKRGYIEGQINLNAELDAEEKQVMDIGGKSIVF